MRDGQVVKEFLARMAQVDGELARYEMLAPIREPLTDALTALTEASDWLLEARAGSPNDWLAGATPYLRLFGTVTGGWLLARSAAAAASLLETGEGDAEFLEAKIATALFYAGQILPTARGLLPSVTAGAEPLFAIGDGRLA
jgi:hypothetical protein